MMQGMLHKMILSYLCGFYKVIV